MWAKKEFPLRRIFPFISPGVLVDPLEIQDKSSSFLAPTTSPNFILQLLEQDILALTPRLEVIPETSVAVDMEAAAAASDDVDVNESKSQQDESRTALFTALSVLYLLLDVLRQSSISQPVFIEKIRAILANARKW